MNAPSDRKYSETHEWFTVEANLVTIGITQHAAEELTDITFVELPQVGASFAAGDSFGEVESVKATSELFTAVGGKVVEVNTSLTERPELINSDPFEEGWIVKIEAFSIDPLRSLMDAKEYKAFVRNAG